MPDTTAPGPSAQEIASFSEAMKAAGQSDEAIQAAIARAGAGPAAPAVHEPSVEDIGRGAITESEAREFRDAMLASGHPEHEIVAALQAQGHSGEIAEAAPDTRSGAQKVFDEDFPAPVASDVHIKWIDHLPPGTTTDELVRANQEAVEFIIGTGLPARVGEYIVEKSYDVVRQLGQMTAPEKAIWKREQRYLVEKLTGDVEGTLQLAAKAARAQENSPFWQSMIAAGALNSADIIMQLAHHGERLTLREQL